MHVPNVGMWSQASPEVLWERKQSKQASGCAERILKHLDDWTTVFIALAGEFK